MASSSKGTEEIQAVEVKNTNENRSTSKLECLTCGLCMGRRRNRKAMTPRLEFKEQPDSTQSTPRPAKREQDGASQPAVTSEPGRAPAERAAISEKSSTTKDESEESRDANSRQTSTQVAEVSKGTEEQDTELRQQIKSTNDGTGEKSEHNSQ